MIFIILKKAVVQLRWFGSSVNHGTIFLRANQISLKFGNLYAYMVDDDPCQLISLNMS